MIEFKPGSTIRGRDRISSPLDTSGGISSTQSGRRRWSRRRRRRRSNSRRKILGSQNPSILTLTRCLSSPETTKTQAKSELELSLIGTRRILRWHNSVVIPGHRRHGGRRGFAVTPGQKKVHEKRRKEEDEEEEKKGGMENLEKDESSWVELGWWERGSKWDREMSKSKGYDGWIGPHLSRLCALLPFCLLIFPFLFPILSISRPFSFSFYFNLIFFILL